MLRKLLTSLTGTIVWLDASFSYGHGSGAEANNANDETSNFSVTSAASHQECVLSPLLYIMYSHVEAHMKTLITGHVQGQRHAD